MIRAFLRGFSMRPRSWNQPKGMYLEVSSKHIDDIGTTSILQQTAFWSEVKKRQGLYSRAFDISVEASVLDNDGQTAGTVTDDILVLLQDIGEEFTIGYVPYGPTLQPSEENRGPFLEELSESLRPHLCEKCTMLRYDLLWRSPWSEDSVRYDSKETWKGPPDRNFQELRMNIGTGNWNLRKPNTNNLPSDTVIIDLTREPQTLMEAMKPKTRYNIRLSERKGVRVRSTGPEELGTWYGLYKETCARNRIHLHDIKYFQNVLEADMKNISPFVEVELLIAELDDVPLAAMFLVHSGPRSTYLYGASSSMLRNHMATYAIQWEAITRSKERGSREYDLFGISPTSNPSHPLYGLYRFKSGFGGKIVHRMGCWDYPMHEGNYELFRSLEMKGQGYHKN